MDYMKFNFDVDGDHIDDSYARKADLDGDGMNDTIYIDLDGDGSIDAEWRDTNGDGVVDMEHQDQNGDGIFDSLAIDLDGDGSIDAEWRDTNGDGVVDMEYQDQNGDGIFDSLAVDIDGDGDYELFYKDLDGDGEADIFAKDLDGDGQIDEQNDLDNDGISEESEYRKDKDRDDDFDEFDVVEDTIYNEAEEVADIDSWEIDRTDLIELEPVFIDNMDNGSYIEDLENFDPGNVDPNNIVGNPGISMQEWECQGVDGPCAIYAQKFVIEEFTGQEIDAQEMIEIAEQNGWYNEGTAIEDLNKMLNYCGIENEMSFDNDFHDIADCLNEGGRVIVGIDADEIWWGENDVFSPGEDPNHAVEVIGIDYSNPEEPMVILNDSGIPDGCGVMVPYNTFMDAWADSGNLMIECQPEYA